MAALPAERITSAAKTLGFEALPELEVGPARAVEKNDTPGRVGKNSGATTEIHEGPKVSMPFWRLDTMTFHDEPEKETSPPNPTAKLTEDDFVSPGKSLSAIPPSLPLAPWSRLWPMLRAALHSTIPSREPDVGALTRAVCRGELVRRIPRILRPTWSGRVSIWIDRSARLTPFWSDQSDVRRRLQKVCDRSGLDVRLLDARTQASSLLARGDYLRGFRPHSDTPILVLGDLGLFGSDVDRAAWLRTGQRLRRNEMRMTALLPCPPARWEHLLSRVWNAVPWERGPRRQALGLSRDASVWRSRAERLLALISPASLVQPSLLRALRFLLPASQADASTEADVWNHADVRAADATGWVLQPEAATRWRNAFVREFSTALKRRASETIGAWHSELPRELLRAETLVWHALVPHVESPGDLRDALDFAGRLEGSVLEAANDPRNATVMKRYGRTLLAGMPETIYERLPALQAVWVASFEGAAVPAGIDPVAIRAKLEKAGEERHWMVRQVGKHLVFAPNERGGEWPSFVEGPGSPMAWLVAARPWITVVRGKTLTTYRLQKGLSIPLEPGQGLELRTDRCTIGITPWRRESWAVAAGRDRYGLWADADIKGVVQRFRWIPPGRFLMGSPESEVGRYDDEGPQHLVTWTGGRWFADTPVTQALWCALERTNPSKFRSDSRPVDRVNWKDCVAFTDMLSYIKARLPTEAEWEYACRAGTTTATWVGDLQVDGEYDAPVLNAIAWYGGNSAAGFELDNGYDISYLDQGQALYNMAGTHPVALKATNPFGLHDVLGNVYEWCADVMAPYRREHKSNPLPMTEGFSNLRILRGGCWASRANRIRASRRWGSVPTVCDFGHGVRLVLGPLPGKEKP